MTSYETCMACHGREAFNLGKCNKCSSHKSASIETREINGVQYYALKSAATKKQEQEQEKPYWVTLWENSGLL